MNTTISSYVTLTTSLAAIVGLINVTDQPLPSSHLPSLTDRPTPPLPSRSLPPLPQRQTPQFRLPSPLPPQRPPPRSRLPPTLPPQRPPPRSRLPPPLPPQRPTPRPRLPPPLPPQRPTPTPAPSDRTPQPPPHATPRTTQESATQGWNIGAVGGGFPGTSSWNIGAVGGGFPGTSSWGGGGVQKNPMPTPPKLSPPHSKPNYKNHKTTETRPTSTTPAPPEAKPWSPEDRLLIYAAPVLIILGTIGNSLSGIVMMRKDLRKTTTSLFLTVLAVVDTAILYTGLLRQWLIIYKDFDIRKVAAATCKLHTFLLYALNQYQAWLLVIVTIERLIAVFLPHQSKRLCTRPAAATSVAISALLIGGLNAHFFWTNQYVRLQYSNDNTYAYCMPIEPKYAAFVRKVWPWIDFIAFSMLPFAILVSSNIAILLRMLYSHYLRRNSLHTHGNFVKMTSMTAILITVTFCFFVTTAPISIYLIITDTVREDSSSVTEGGLRLMWVIFNLLTYTNNTINFLLYCVSGSRFRRELINMFRRKNRIKPTSHSGTMEIPLNHAAHSSTLHTNLPATSGVNGAPTPGHSHVVTPSVAGQSSANGVNGNGNVNGNGSGNGSVTHR